MVLFFINLKEQKAYSLLKKMIGLVATLKHAESIMYAGWTIDFMFVKEKETRDFFIP